MSGPLSMPGSRRVSMEYQNLPSFALRVSGFAQSSGNQDEVAPPESPPRNRFAPPQPYAPRKSSHSFESASSAVGPRHYRLRRGFMTSLFRQGQLSGNAARAAVCLRPSLSVAALFNGLSQRHLSCMCGPFCFFGSRHKQNIGKQPT